ncbi:MAG: MBL fold metallo-hydrolase [Ketobacter sp.]|nr:MAG: MBL fold metallo-hydrolase [Ketobacter sp.]
MKAQWLAGPNRNITRFGEVPVYKEGLYRVGTRSYAWMVPNGTWGETNIGLIDCDGKSILIDTCWDLKFTRELLETADPVLRKSPVEIVINTHSDGDHCWGNQLFKDKEIIATHACIEQMHHLKPASMTALKSGGRLLRHLPLMKLDSFGHYMRTMFSPYDFSDVSITDPNKGFSGKHELTVNGVDIVVMEVGPGHTDGDAIVYVPDEGLVYAGDILFIGGTPVMWSGPVENLVKALEILRSLNAKTIVPGHGPMASDQQVQSVINYWHFAHEHLHRCYQRDMTPTEAARDVLFSKAFQESEFAGWNCPERLVTNAYSMYRNWGANLLNLPGPLGVMDQMRNQASVAFNMPQAEPRCMHGFVHRI